ncbi:hypothetical protein J3E72DRAFT_274028 [Bipolaris maydis]|nr:hypothetical protein J3E72DRAFT_274028 [Bipolaris maydis]
MLLLHPSIRVLATFRTFLRASAVDRRRGCHRRSNPHRNPPSAVSTCELRSPVALSSPTCSRAPAACPSTLAWCTVAIARFKSQPTASSTRLLDLPPYPISRPVAFAGTEIVAGDHEQPDYDRFYYELFAIPG